MKILKSIDPQLDRLIQKYGTDKLLSQYNCVYASLFADKRQNLNRVLEVGIGSFITEVCNFSVIKRFYPYYKPGGSLRVWRDYFPNAEIHGIDLGEDCRIEEDRIKTFIFDSLNETKVNKLLKNYSYDLIIDDGDHRLVSQLTTFSNLSKLVKKGGYYIVEDILPEIFEEIQKIKEFKNFSIIKNIKDPLVLQKN